MFVFDHKNRLFKVVVGEVVVVVLVVAAVAAAAVVMVVVVVVAVEVVAAVAVVVAVEVFPDDIKLKIIFEKQLLLVTLILEKLKIKADFYDHKNKFQNNFQNIILDMFRCTTPSSEEKLGVIINCSSAVWC